MNTRNVIPVSLLSTNALSSATSTAVPTAVDLANYFPVGRREILYVVSIAAGTTTLSATATLTLEECASTSTASFTSILNAAGSTATWTTTANSVPTNTSFYGISNYRYVRARYVCSTSTGDYVILNVTALPLVRAG